MKELNDRKREFARLLAAGSKQSAAYRKVFECKAMASKTVNSNACRLAKDDSVIQYLAEIRQQKDERAIINRRKRMELLSSMAVDACEAGKVRESIAAIAELNRMDGACAPDKLEIQNTRPMVEGIDFSEVLARVSARIQEEQGRARCLENAHGQV